MIDTIYFLFSGASHSALGDMKTITQESSSKNVTAIEPRSRDIDNDRDLFMSLDEFYTALSIPYSNNNSNKIKSEEVVVIAEPEPPKRQPLLSRQNNNKSDNKSSGEGEAQKKFGSAKAISSDQYFQDSNYDDSVSKSGHYFDKVLFELKCGFIYNFYLFIVGT